MNPATKHKKYYVVYKTTNLINNKIYVGFHSTDDLNDSYLSSGKILLDAVKKHGKENFTRELIQVFDNQEDAENLEAEIVNSEFVLREDTYNIALGGNVRIMVGENNPWYGEKHTQETLDKIQKSRNKTIDERGYVRSKPTHYWFRFNNIDFRSQADQKMIVILSYLGFKDRELTLSIKKKYKHLIGNVKIGTKLKSICWDMKYAPI